jgi:hypothetical protein
LWRRFFIRLANMTVIRWILVPVAAFGVWCVTLLAGITGHNILDSMCPQELMISGICTAWWHSPAVRILEVACAGFAAVAFVVIPAMIAPAHRLGVAIAAFGCGALLSAFLAVAADFWLPVLAAAVTGSIALYRAVLRWRTRSTIDTESAEPEP